MKRRILFLALIFSVLFFGMHVHVFVGLQRTHWGVMALAMTDSKPTNEQHHVARLFVEIVSFVAGSAVCAVVVARVAIFFYECVAPPHLTEKEAVPISFTGRKEPLLFLEEFEEEEFLDGEQAA
jgi:hypothetical protein